MNPTILICSTLDLLEIQDQDHSVVQNYADYYYETLYGQYITINIIAYFWSGENHSFILLYLPTEFETSLSV